MFNNIISEIKPIVDLRSVQIIKTYSKSFSRSGSFGDDVINQITFRITKGKTIRGSLLVFSTSAFDSKRTNGAIDCASAIELIQLGFLIHDDIMDQDKTRRGALTLHTIYAKKMSNETAESLAMCVGDILFFVGNDIIARSTLPTDTKTKIIQQFSLHLMNTAISQMDDVYFTEAKNTILEKNILRLYEYKTAHYTFSLPLIIGAIIAEKQSLIPVLTKLGRSIGLLFQIQDDMLDLFGNEKYIGKPVGSDIREGKKTIMHSLLYSHASRKDKRFLNTCFGNEKLTKKHINKIQDMVRLYAIDTLIKKKTQYYKKTAIKYIEKLPMSSQNMKVLFDLVDYVSQRGK